uniref:Uncharacterized protein n=2 Tax=Setaria TaxID=4554 RepID=K3Y0M5_SETIT|nr:hypothetical protein SEVIR_4G086701v2 [Setaria viridis]
MPPPPSSPLAPPSSPAWVRSLDAQRWCGCCRRLILHWRLKYLQIQPRRTRLPGASAGGCRSAGPQLKLGG